MNEYLEWAESESWVSNDKPHSAKNDDNGTEPSEPDHEKPIGYGAISDLIYISNGGQNEGPLNCSHPEKNEGKMALFLEFCHFRIRIVIINEITQVFSVPSVFNNRIFETLISSGTTKLFFSNNGLAANPKVF